MFPLNTEIYFTLDCAIFCLSIHLRITATSQSGNPKLITSTLQHITTPHSPEGVGIL